jgi:predicted permease
MLLQDLRYSLRLLRRTPGFSAVAVLVLALGIGANTAVFSIVNALLLKPMPGRVGELVGVFNKDRTKPDLYRGFSYAAYADIRDGSDVFESVMAHTFALVGVRDGDATRRTFAAVVSSNYFTTLGVRLAAGRPFSADEERPGAAIPVAIVSDGFWRRAGGDRQFVGRTISVNATMVTVVGIAPPGFTGTMAIASPDLWFPLGVYDQMVTDIFKQQAHGIGDRRSDALMVAGRLKPGLSLAAAEPHLDRIATRLAAAYPDTDRDRTFTLAPLQRLGSSTNPQSRNPLAVVSGMLLLMAALVLGVACLNLANLMLARSAARRKEIAIRLALGGGRARIVRQLLTEGLVLSVAGAAAGLVLAWWTTSLLAASMSRVFPVSVVIDAAPDARVFAAAGAFAIVSTVFFALGPAWSASRAELVPDLKADTRDGAVGGRGVSRLMSGPVLVIGQLAVSLALVVAGGLFVRGGLNIAGTDPGFSLDRQLIVGVDPGMAGYDEAKGRATYRTMLDRLRALPGVEHASVASTVPFGDMTEGRDARVGDRKANPVYVIVGADYFKTLGLPMLRGREFTPLEELASPRAASLAIVNEPLARKLFGDGDPIGRQVQIGERERGTERTFEVIGLAPGLRHDVFDAGPVAQVYVAAGGPYRGSMNLHVHVAGAPGSESSMLDAVRRELHQVDPRLPIISMRTMTEHRDASILSWSVRVAAGLFSAFGVLALLLATIGVYGLKAYDVSRRTREIGIRMALGATSGDMKRLVMREGARTTIIGVGIGLLLAAGIGKLLSGLLYRVSPFDPVVLTLAAVVLSASAMLACYLPARRVTRVVPLEALRAE